MIFKFKIFDGIFFLPSAFLLLMEEEDGQLREPFIWNNNNRKKDPVILKQHTFMAIKLNKTLCFPRNEKVKY